MADSFRLGDQKQNVHSSQKLDVSLCALGTVAAKRRFGGSGAVRYTLNPKTLNPEP